MNKPSNALSKYIDELITKTPSMTALVDGKKEMTWADGTALQRLRKYEETTRIVTAIQQVYEGLDEDRKAFIQNYYWRPDSLTLDTVGSEMFVSRRTVYRWKEEVTEAIARRLGWL